MDPRYEGKPLLRIAELYVIAAIGELTPEHEGLLTTMSPKLCEVYGVDKKDPNKDWRDALEVALSFPEGTREVIADTWAKAQKISEEEKMDLTPEQFALVFIDANVPHQEE